MLCGEEYRCCVVRNKSGVGNTGAVWCVCGYVCMGEGGYTGLLRGYSNTMRRGEI